MVDNSTSHNFLARRHSTGNGHVHSTVVLPAFPPTTPDHVCQEFNTPEGTYTQHHSIFMSTIQPLYSVGTVASLISIKHKESTTHLSQPGARSFRNLFHHNHSHSNTDSDEDHSSSSSSNKNNPFRSSITEESTKVTSNSEITLAPSSTTTTTTISFLARSHTIGRNPRKPKTSITKKNTNFVTKIITNDQLTKILAARTRDDINLFYNCGTSFVWIDAKGHPKDPLSRIIFAKACPTSHDVNLVTCGVDQLDIIIGFTSGDIMWFDPLCNKYGRINKGGLMNSSQITTIKWLPGSDNLFMAAFQDGTIMLLDKEKEDDHFHPTGKPMFASTNVNRNEKNMFNISKPLPKHAPKCNPVSHWKLSNKPITAFAYSPDGQFVAIVGLDGLLRIVNIFNETMYDVYESYYGGLNCVAWSPDGKYIITGGEDDLVTIWGFREQRIIARCRGHKSWVRNVAFDPWRCDEKVYRFASVGEDANLILWDFSVNALHRPKTKYGNRNRGASISSVNSPPPSSIHAKMQEKRATIHPVLSKTEVAFLQPTVVKTIHGDPCIGVYFREDVIVTTDKRGRVNIWHRPTNSNS